MTTGTLPAAPAEEDAYACLERRCSRRMALASVSMAAGEEISGVGLCFPLLLLTALRFLPLKKRLKFLKKKGNDGRETLRKVDMGRERA
jgi:hypothetical protein